MDESLSLRLIKARSAMGWSQQNLSEVSGVAAAQISRYEAGRSSPRAEVVAKLAKALNVEFAWLAHGEGSVGAPGDVPKYPSGVTIFPLDIPPEHYSAIAKFAEEEGLSIEMALRKLVLDGLAGRSGGTELDEIRRRVEKLEQKR